MKKTLLTLLVAASLSGNAVQGWAATPDDQLVIGLSMANILTLDPAAIAGRESTAIITNVYDTPVQLDAVDVTQVNPGLAESWDVSEDGVITLNFRDDAVFASGNPVTVEDAIWSWKRILELELVGSATWQAYGFTLDNFDQHVTAEGNTITITMPQEGDPQLILYMFGKPSASSVIDSQTALEHEVDGDLAAGWLTTNTAGSGPFTLRNWTANDTIVLDRFDGYWGGAPDMRRVLIRHMPESQTKRLMLERSDIDVGLALSVPDINALSANEDVVVQSVPSSGFYYLAVSMKDEKFADENVRLALRYLIDYQGINETIMPNYGILHQRPVTPGVMGTIEAPGYTLDVERAQEYLAEAGYPDGFTTQLLAINEPPFIDIATSIQSTLAQAGINAEIVTGTGNQVYGPMRERDFEMIVGRGGGGQEPHPHSNMQSLVINPDNSDDAGLSGLIGWRTSFYNEELNALATQALVERDPEEQAQLYAEVQYLYEELVPAIQPVSAVVDTVVFRSDIEGFQNHYGWTTRFDTVSKSR
ncbi:ABC transporter substrate-binding protein [Pelagibacterium sp. 26DY04]|uniref:ABC transporter substrate-binding protein n=1 Tax=Pelagibacterium sp. 26DY04 TaxID=2967130 RepID=UPI002816011A|nr:ABC transporter substrate-binding protein [Pelagibacterium sp. 26DY04]WMT85936.1 ABC transporter substrate-binding protein [Pelagibacterium sp. 26DY04]